MSSPQKCEIRSIMARPTSVTVFGVLNVVFGILAVLGLIASAASLLLAASGGQADPPGFDHPVMKVWIPISVVLGFIAAVAQIASGIGLFKLRDWARKVSIAYAMYAVVATVLGTTLQIVFMVLPMLRNLRNQGAEETMVIVVLVSSFIGALAGLIYPLLLWYYMTRRHVVAAFGPPGAAVDALVDWSPSEAVPQVPLSDNPFASPHTTAQNPQYAEAPNAVDSVISTMIPSKNGPALTAYYLGLLSLFPCLGFPIGIFAVYFGVQGIRKVRQDPNVRGGVHAWIGVVCGGLFGFMNLCLLVLAIFGASMAALGK